LEFWLTTTLDGFWLEVNMVIDVISEIFSFFSVAEIFKILLHCVQKIFLQFHNKISTNQKPPLISKTEQPCNVLLIANEIEFTFGEKTGSNLDSGALT